MTFTLMPEGGGVGNSQVRIEGREAGLEKMGGHAPSRGREREGRVRDGQR